MSGALADPAAERAVISSLYKYGYDAYIDITEIGVNTDTFTIDSNQILFRCIEHIVKENPSAKVDLPSILSAGNELGYSDFLSDETERKHLRHIINYDPNESNISKFAAKIKKFEIARLYYHTHDKSKNDIASINGTESITDIISISENPIFELSDKLNANTTNITPMGEEGEEYLDHLVNNPRDMIGISTGFSKLDMAIGGGLRRGAVDIIAARAKKGKTTVADNVALHIAGNGIPVLNLDTELNQREHLVRIWANLSGVQIKKIEQGRLDKDELKLVRGAQQRLASMPYYYLPIGGVGIEDVLGNVRRWLKRSVGLDENGKINNCAIIYDYLKLMSDDPMKDHIQEYQAIGFMLTKIVNFVRKHDIPCLSFVQLNKDGLSKESEDVISMSDRINWFASSITIYKSKEQEEIQADGHKNGNRKFIVLLSRYGEEWDRENYISMHFDGGINRLTQGLTRFEILKGESNDSSDFVVEDTEEITEYEF